MSFSQGLDLTKSSLQRFIETANYKTSWWLILPEAKYGLEANAELIDVQECRNPPFTAKAIFRVDRAANNVPHHFVAPAKRYHNRSVYIKQILASEIVEKFGLSGVVFLGALPDVRSTQELAEHFKTRFGLEMVAEDIQNQSIPEGAKCIMVRFSRTSLGFRGMLRVDIATPVVEVEAE